MKRTFILMLSATMLLTSACNANANDSTGTVQETTQKVAAPLKDLAGYEWSPIADAVAQGYVSGFPDGTFKPGDMVTRAQFLKMAAVALNYDVNINESAANWYDPYVDVALQKGLYKEVDFSRSELDKPMTRKELARIAVRGLGESFSTDNEMMYKATGKGLITGMGNGELAPDTTTNRAQAVTIIDRILKVNRGETLQTDKNALNYAEVAYRGTNLNTVFGAEPIDFPYTTYVGDGLKFTVHQLIIVDMSKPDSAYYKMFKDDLKVRQRHGNINQSYLYAFRATLVNEKVRPRQNESVRQFVSMIEAQGAYTKDDLNIFPMHETGTWEGWLVFSKDKKPIDDGIAENGQIYTLYLSKNDGTSMHFMKMPK
ncbi:MULTISPECIES: S-layer homology domain-containing protein [unclassified Paenibacillus]|uniref:S-layer homology domain-containing protein n=1 Tax=unclassified Paenibacillus TaxID=185978 RepID=UPI0006D09C37|nr:MULTISPECIES: S-layer homology domain-containing protein [unclassified Paenibacillus]